MEGKKIKLSIDTFGRPKIEAEGYTGEECKNATAGLERALSGRKGVETTLKQEFYETAPAETLQEFN